MVFENGVKNIQAAAYNGARSVTKLDKSARTHNIISGQVITSEIHKDRYKVSLNSPSIYGSENFCKRS